MRYIILTLIVGFIVFISIKGCFYPTSYRAFVPNFLDAQYKEFKKFSQKEIGRVLYARPLTGIEKSNLNEDSFYRVTRRYGIDNKDMFVGIEYVYLEDKMVYIYIKELGFYGGWNKWKFNFFILPNTTRKSYNSIESLTKNNSQIIQNKEVIGNLKKDTNATLIRIYIVIDGLLDKPNDQLINLTKGHDYDFAIKSSLDELNYLKNLNRNYDYFEDLQ